MGGCRQLTLHTQGDHCWHEETIEVRLWNGKSPSLAHGWVRLSGALPRVVNPISKQRGRPPRWCSFDQRTGRAEHGCDQGLIMRLFWWASCENLGKTSPLSFATMAVPMEPMKTNIMMPMWFTNKFGTAIRKLKSQGRTWERAPTAWYTRRGTSRRTKSWPSSGSASRSKMRVYRPRPFARYHCCGS